jgi:lexA DNA binding domain
MKSWKQLTENEVSILNEIDYVRITFNIKGQNRNRKQGGQMSGQIGGQMPKNRIEILRLVIENNYITRKELTQKVGIASSAIQKHLEVLVNEGYIKREGKTKSSYWVILKQIDSSIHKE